MRWKLKRSAAMLRRRLNRSTRSPSPGALGELETLALMLLAIALEVTPLTAVLQTAAATLAGDAAMSALPLWFLIVVVALATAVGARLQHRIPSIALAVGVTLGGTATYVAALRVSPAAYANVAATPALSLAWLAQISADFMVGAPRATAALGLLLLVAYLWWRGVRLGGLNISYDRIARAFQLGLAVLVLSLIATAALAGPARLTIDARLALIMPLEVGFGLTGLTLAHISDTITQHAPTAETPDPGQLRPSRWLLTALTLAGAIVIGALLLALAFSYSTLLALAQALSPIGAALGSLLSWLAYALAFVLFLLLNPLIQWIAGLLRAQSHTTSPSQPPSSPIRPPNTPRPPGAPALPPQWIVAGQVATGVLLVLVAFVSAYLLLQSLRRARTEPEAAGLEETRESLDMRALLAAQLRALFTPRHARRRAQSDDDLDASSVRHAYRAVLRATLASGHGRRAAETPAEYYQRWSGMAAEQPGERFAASSEHVRYVTDATRSAFSKLTQLYEYTRYGPPSDASANARDAHGEARSAARQIIASLSRREPQRANHDARTAR